jgi:hypothetical protein
MELDAENNNTKFRDAVAVEMGQINDYRTFIDHGKAEYDAKSGRLVNPPPGYNYAKVHLVFDVKHDGRHKARLVCDGHLTMDPDESSYSSVVSLKSLRIITFCAEHNGLELWGADVGNAYLEALTKEKLYIIAGPEFGELEGHILILHKALYGIKTS